MIITFKLVKAAKEVPYPLVTLVIMFCELLWSVTVQSKPTGNRAYPAGAPFRGLWV